tara:strand:+ start:3125 stop:3466 length:342 start_codon:yes stop_codon:yes gene_type:complete
MEKIESKSFLLYKHLEPIVQQLDDNEAGMLFKIIYTYEVNGISPTIDNKKVLLAFTMFQIHLDKGREDYIKKCETNRANAKRRYATAIERSSSQTNRNTNTNRNKKQWKGIDE